jgi:hypothetical protein
LVLQFRDGWAAPSCAIGSDGGSANASGSVYD